MKLFVTGGAGFIGSNFIRHILNKYPSYEVVNFDKLTYAGNLENLKDVDPASPRFLGAGNDPRYKFVKGDICDKSAVAEAIKDCDIIVNFAAESHVDRSILDSADFIKTNILGTHNLLEAAKNDGLKRLHHISTDEVFGHLGLDDLPFHEKTPYAPRSPYSASKAAADHLVMAYFKTYDLPVTISNCSNNYGPYQFPEKLHGLFITNLIENKKVPVYGDGMQVRDWLYVLDHCEAIDLIIHKGLMGESYCVGGNNEKPNMEIVKKILELLGKDESHIEYVADRRGHDRRYAVNTEKIRVLGWEPKTSFDGGLTKTVEWYKNNQSWWKKIKSGEYLDYYRRQYN